MGEVRGMWAKRRTIASLCGRSEVEYTLNGTRTVSLARGMDPRHPTDMHVTGCRASRGCAPASWGGIIHHMSSVASGGKKRGERQQRRHGMSGGKQSS